MWGSHEDEKYSAKNVLSNEDDFSNSTHANYWLAKKGEVKDQGFVIKVGNSKRKIVGVNLRNTHNITNATWATDIFKLEGALLEDPETLEQRIQGLTPLTWTPAILRAAGQWDKLIFRQMESELQTFFFTAVRELRYLWFHLRTFHGEGGGLQYFGPILQTGASLVNCFISISLNSDVCSWTAWTSCDWFCDEEDPLVSTRNLQKKEEVSQNIDHLCDEKEVLGCYENCTGKYG